MSAPFTITHMHNHALIQATKTIHKGWECPHCGGKPKGTWVADGDKWLKNKRFFIAPHTCKGGTMTGGYEYTMWSALSAYWGPWVREQRKIIATPPPVVNTKPIKSFWQKLLTGWN